ncbi:DUF3888 domain-containing protein [Rossellomorea aquimaris]|uniref:DUF3888 domain-containing protein n=1 Tax=Rossellomorea aquimaris TaxID=189382 RepID=A0A1J6W1P2_9BACI|nr:DUF3888 domain-containing protein [Rossellomorea aquimaris]OIU71525.1 hypothetical protein BHE18_21975 [Rossellomorea aquimaris]
MRKIQFIFLLTLLLTTLDTNHYANAAINEADTKLCETYKYALISSLREPVDQAVAEIYKDDKEAPSNLIWATYDAEILKIKQLYGVGGLYEITLKVYPYYDAHMSYGVDEVVINSNGELISYKHLKTYPR